MLRYLVFPIKLIVWFMITIIDDSWHILDFNSTVPFIDPKESLQIVSRSEWVAQPPENALAPMKLPAKYVIIAHTATENCTTKV